MQEVLLFGCVLWMDETSIAQFATGPCIVGPVCHCDAACGQSSCVAGDVAHLVC